MEILSPGPYLSKTSQTNSPKPPEYFTPVLSKVLKKNRYKYTHITRTTAKPIKPIIEFQLEMILPVKAKASFSFLPSSTPQFVESTASLFGLNGWWTQEAVAWINIVPWWTSVLHHRTSSTYPLSLNQPSLDCFRDWKCHIVLEFVTNLVLKYLDTH